MRWRLVVFFPSLLLGLLIMHGGLEGMSHGGLIHSSSVHQAAGEPAARTVPGGQTALMGVVDPGLVGMHAGQPGDATWLDCRDGVPPPAPAGPDSHPGPVCGAFLRAATEVGLLVGFALWLLVAPAAGRSPAVTWVASCWRPARARRPQPPDLSALCVLRL